MNTNKKQRIQILLLMTLAVIVMGYVDGVWQPGYLIKSIIKIVIFTGLTLLYCVINKEHILEYFFKGGIKLKQVLLGTALYCIIVGAYFVARRFYDFTRISGTLLNSTGVSKNNFLFVSIYISFVNSFLEEFFFRGFGFLLLKRKTSKKISYLCSGLLFAIYHCAMMGGWFNPVLFALVISGLVVGGLFFDYLDDKSDSIFTSWTVHMFANFAINTVGIMIL